jgi:hypothetical protein
VPGQREVMLDPGDHCGHSGQQPRARQEPARTGCGPSSARCGLPRGANRSYATADDVPVACLIGRSAAGTYGHSGQPDLLAHLAYKQADPLRIPTFQAITPRGDGRHGVKRARLHARHPVRGRAAGWGTTGFCPSLRVATCDYAGWSDGREPFSGQLGSTPPKVGA